VLYVDGIAADRADGIWTDAGGTVDCYMTHAFSEQRSYAVELRVENVLPGDFDDASNTVSRSIAIVPPSSLAAFGFTAQSDMEDAWWRSVSTFTTWEGVEETWDQTYHVSGPIQYSSASALLPRTLTFPITLHGTMSSNGTTVNVMDQTYETADYVDWQQGRVAAVRALVLLAEHCSGRAALDRFNSPAGVPVWCSAVPGTRKHAPSWSALQPVGPSSAASRLD
jgi:hypothetical protein